MEHYDDKVVYYESQEIPDNWEEIRLTQTLKTRSNFDSKSAMLAMKNCIMRGKFGEASLWALELLHTGNNQKDLSLFPMIWNFLFKISFEIVGTANFDIIKFVLNIMKRGRGTFRDDSRILITFIWHLTNSKKSSAIFWSSQITGKTELSLENLYNSLDSAMNSNETFDAIRFANLMYEKDVTIPPNLIDLLRKYKVENESILSFIWIPILRNDPKNTIFSALYEISHLNTDLTRYCYLFAIIYLTKEQKRSPTTIFDQKELDIVTDDKMFDCFEISISDILIPNFAIESPGIQYSIEVESNMKNLNDVDFDIEFILEAIDKNFITSDEKLEIFSKKYETNKSSWYFYKIWIKSYLKDFWSK